MQLPSKKNKFWRLLAVLCFGGLLELLLFFFYYRDIALSGLILWVLGILFAGIVLFVLATDMEEYQAGKNPFSYLATALSGILLIGLCLSLYHLSKRYNSESLIVASSQLKHKNQKDSIKIDFKRNGDCILLGDGKIQYGKYSRKGLNLFIYGLDIPNSIQTSNLKILRTKHGNKDPFDLVQMDKGKEIQNSLRFDLLEDNRLK